MTQPTTAPASILFLIDELQEWRGTEVHLFRLLTHLDRARFRPVVAILGRAGLAAEFRAASIPVHELKITSVFSLHGLRGAFAIARLCRREQIRLIVAYHTAADLLAPPAAKLARCRSISCRRDNGFTKKPIHKRVQRWLHPLAGGVIAVSADSARAVERDERYPAARTRVIWNGEDLDVFKPGPPALRRELGIADGACVLTCVGGLDPVKNHATLIDAFSRVSARHPQAVLLFAGQGALRAELERQAAPLGDRVRFLGHRGDIPDLLRASDIYVQVSHTEGFSNAILQAMATALPVVASAVGGNLELVTPDVGRLLPPTATDQIADALADLIADPDLRRQLGAAARARVEEHGSLASMTASYADAFTRALARRPLISPAD